MYFQRISGRNVRGHDFDVELAPLTILTGANEAGKSSVLLAGIMAVRGYGPICSTANNVGTFAASSGDTMSVKAVLADPDLVVERTWSQGKNITRVDSDSCSRLPEMTLPLLSFHSFIASGKAQRTKLIYQSTKVDVDAEAIKAKVVELEAVKGNAEVTATVTKALKAANAEEKDVPQLWLTAATARLAEEVSKADKNAKTMKSTSSGAATLQKDATKGQAAVNETEVNRRADALKEAQSALERAKGDLEARKRSAGEVERTHREWSDKLVRLEAQSEGRTAREHHVVKAELDGLRQHRQELAQRYEDERTAFQAFRTAQDNRPRLDEALADADRELTALRELESKLPSHRRAVADAKAAVEAIKQGASHVEELATAARTSEVAYAAKRGELDDIAARGLKYKEDAEAGLEPQDCVCPTCLQSASWEVLKPVFQAAHEGLRPVVRELKAQRDAANEAYAEAKADYNQKLHKADEAVRLAETVLAATNTKLARLDEVERRHARAIRELLDCDTVLDEAPAEPVVPDFATLDQQITELDREADIAVALLSLQSHRDAEPAKPEDGNFQEDEDAITTEAERIASEQDEVARLSKQLAEHKAHEAAQQAAQDARIAAEATHKALKAGHAVLAKELKDSVAEAYGPLLEKMAHFTDGILDTPVELHPTTNELGRFKDGAFVGLDQFGGAHIAITAVAFQAALGAVNGVGFVFADELGVLDPKLRPKFLKNVAKAIQSGVLQQFVGIDPDPEHVKQIQKAVPSVTVVTMGESA